MANLTPDDRDQEKKKKRLQISAVFVMSACSMEATVAAS